VNIIFLAFIPDHCDWDECDKVETRRAARRVLGGALPGLKMTGRKGNKMIIKVDGYWDEKHRLVEWWAHEGQSGCHLEKRTYEYILNSYSDIQEAMKEGEKMISEEKGKHEKENGVEMDGAVILAKIKDGDDDLGEVYAVYRNAWILVFKPVNGLSFQCSEIAYSTLESAREAVRQDWANYTIEMIV